MDRLSSGGGVASKSGYGHPTEQYSVVATAAGAEEECKGYRPKRSTPRRSIAQRMSYFAADDNRMPKLFRILCCFIVLLVVLVILGFLLAKFVVFTQSKESDTKSEAKLGEGITIKSVTLAASEPNAALAETLVQVRAKTLPALENRWYSSSETSSLSLLSSVSARTLSSIPESEPSKPSKRSLFSANAANPSQTTPEKSSSRFLAGEVSAVSAAEETKADNTGWKTAFNSSPFSVTLREEQPTVTTASYSVSKMEIGDVFETSSSVLLQTTIASALSEQDKSKVSIENQIDVEVGTNQPETNFPNENQNKGEKDEQMPDYVNEPDPNESRVFVPTKSKNEMFRSTSKDLIRNANSNEDSENRSATVGPKIALGRNCDSNWTSWTECLPDSFCGPGHKNRSRTDESCELKTEIEPCSANPCLKISDVEYGAALSFCSKFCGGGSQLKTAACLQMDIGAYARDLKNSQSVSDPPEVKYFEVDQKVCVLNGVANSSEFYSKQATCCEHRCNFDKGETFGRLSNKAVTMTYESDPTRDTVFTKQHGQQFCLNHIAIIDLEIPQLANYLCNHIGKNGGSSNPSLVFEKDRGVPVECTCSGGFIDLLVYRKQSNSEGQMGSSDEVEIAWTTALRFGNAQQFVSLQC